MDLPQTLPGAPAAGIDPTSDELAGMSSLDHVFDWLGSDQVLRTAVVAALGGGTLKMRDVVYIPGTQWDAAVDSLQVAIPAGEGTTSRDPSPKEIGHLAMLRRISRLRLGLTAVEEAPAQTPQSITPTLALGGPSPSGPAPQGVVATVGEPRLKLSSVLDPVLDTELVRMAQHLITKLFSDYARKRGAEPSEEIEPTTEQISAMAQVLAADLSPYACFSVFGPHGRRLLQKLTYLCWTYLPSGQWQRRELPGPPCFSYWWECFRVLRTLFLLLDTVDPETVDNYGELIRGFSKQYGDECWSIVYTADVRMRSERFTRLRRQAEGDHSNKLAASLPSTFDVKRPWNTVFSLALADKSWWEEQVHRPAVLFLSRARTEAQLLHDGTAQPALPASSSHLGYAKPKRERSRSPRARKPAWTKPLAIEDNAKPICEAWNTRQGCKLKKSGKCPKKHGVCSNCGGFGHQAFRCKGPKAKDGAQRG